MPPQLLDRQAFAKARNFILEHARPLERAQFQLHFEQGPEAAVVEALGGFQNPDGGFGNALEPDLRLPGSSAIATSEAFVVLRELKAKSGALLRRQAVQYVLDSFDPGRPGWPAVPLQVNDFPHAPWWQQPNTPQAKPEEVWGNPDADLIGALHEHADWVPPSLLEEWTALALEKLATTPEITPYVARCYLRLCNAMQSSGGAIRQRLFESADGVMAQVDGSSIQPFWLAETPKGPFAEACEPAVQQSLDREIGRQGANGAWPPVWTWFGNYPDDWEVAAREWSGQQTLMTLRSLRNWGRIPHLD